MTEILIETSKGLVAFNRISKFEPTPDTKGHYACVDDLGEEPVYVEDWALDSARRSLAPVIPNSLICYALQDGTDENGQFDPGKQIVIGWRVQDHAGWPITLDPLNECLAVLFDDGHVEQAGAFSMWFETLGEYVDFVRNERRVSQRAA